MSINSCITASLLCLVRVYSCIDLFRHFLCLTGWKQQLTGRFALCSFIQRALQSLLQGEASSLRVSHHTLVCWHLWVMPLQMLDYLELLLGPVGAVATAERLLLGVRQVVMSEPRRPPEGLLAQPARVRPVVAVLPLVGLQDEAGLEGLAALLADVRARVAVLRVAVRAEGVRSVGAVITLVAGVRFLSCTPQTFKMQPNHISVLVFTPGHWMALFN